MSSQLYNGTLITIEGIDGSGKSSAAQALYTTLLAHYDVLLTKEPGATSLGKQLRALLQGRTFALYPKAEFLLFAADRAQHIEEIVLPALREGKIVISDRMADSSRAYQGFGRGLDDQWIRSINEWAMNGIQPDITIYLKIDYQTAFKRLALRQEAATVFEQEKAAFFDRVIMGFEKIFSERSNVITIDASLPQEEVQQEVYARVLPLLKKLSASPMKMHRI